MSPRSGILSTHRLLVPSSSDVLGRRPGPFSSSASASASSALPPFESTSLSTRRDRAALTVPPLPLNALDLKKKTQHELSICPSHREKGAGS